MLTIRLTRKGKKNQPFFRVVVIDKKRSSKGGRAVEDLGYKNPLTKKTSLNKERILYWIKTGAQPSASVHNLLVSEKIIEAKKIVKKSIKPAVVVGATPATPAITATSEVVVAPAPASALEGSGEAKPVETQKDLPAPTEEPKPTEPQKDLPVQETPKA